MSRGAGKRLFDFRSANAPATEEPPQPSSSVCIELTQGFFTIVDEADGERVSKYKWRAQKNRRCIYAVRWADGSKCREIVSLHRFILGLLDKSKVVDHISGDGLDNRRCNLRITTAAINSQSQFVSSSNTSGFRGVHWNRYKWAAVIGQHPRVHLGVFGSPESAARAYDEAARAKYGEFARLNFPKPGERSCFRPSEEKRLKLVLSSTAKSVLSEDEHADFMAALERGRK